MFGGTRLYFFHVFREFVIVTRLGNSTNICWLQGVASHVTWRVADGWRCYILQLMNVTSLIALTVNLDATSRRFHLAAPYTCLSSSTCHIVSAIHWQCWHASHSESAVLVLLAPPGMQGDGWMIKQVTTFNPKYDVHTNFHGDLICHFSRYFYCTAARLPNKEFIAYAEIAQHASRLMPPKCKTPHVHTPWFSSVEIGLTGYCYPAQH